MQNLPSIIEGILFVAGNGVEVDEIAEKLQIDKKEVQFAVEELQQKYNETSGIQIISYKNKIQLCTNPEFADAISIVLNPIWAKGRSGQTFAFWHNGRVFETF